MKKLNIVLIAILCFGGLVASEASFAGQNVLYYFSEPGDYIGQGAEVTFTDTDGTFTISPNYANGVNLSFITPSYEHWWYLNLNAADNAVLQTGAYENTQRFPFQEPGFPGLDFSGDGRGCNTSSGRFDVLEIVRDTNGTITQLAANFEQHCEGGEPALYGQIRYNSDVPLSGKPIHITLENPLNVDKCVEATRPKGAMISVEALGISDTNGGDALNFDWSTTTGETSTGSTFSFKAPITLDNQNPVVVTLTVTDLINNSKKSVTKSVCVSDTTAPTIVINTPFPGETVHGDNLILDVSIKDKVDKNISQYEVQVGSHFLSPINPRSGRSRQQIFDAPKADGSVTTTITVNAHDVYGNSSEQSVTVNQIPTKGKANSHHFWKPRRE